LWGKSNRKDSQMIRNLKLLGLAAVAVLSMSAMLASAAQAEKGTLTAESYPTILTGAQTGPLASTIIAGGIRTFHCTTVDLNGTITGPSASVTLTPLYSGCTSTPGSLPGTLFMNGCDYTLSLTRPGSTGHPAGTGGLSTTIDCPAGSVIEKKIYETAAKHSAGTPLCHYTVAAQGPIPAGTYHNNAGPPKDITLTMEVKPVTVNKIGPAILCGAAAGANIAMTAKGTYTLEGFKDSEGNESGTTGIFGS
jgi:hypothetical protein